MNDRPIVKMTIRGLNKMGYHQRRQLAAWMRKHARKIEAAGADKKYAGRFTARHF